MKLKLRCSGYVVDTVPVAITAFYYLYFAVECCYLYFIDKEIESLERLYWIIQKGLFFLYNLKLSKTRAFSFCI